MASNIPAGLKSADIGRFAVRAAQVERAKPVIAYWCEYPQRPTLNLTDKLSFAIGNFWIVNQIIEKGLHNTDDEVKLYTTNLVDKLEQVCLAVLDLFTRKLTCGDASSKPRTPIMTR